MAHAIVEENGRAMMMFAGSVPWHGLGTALDRPATSVKAIEAAGLGWEVHRKPLYAQCAAGVQAVGSHVALVRETQKNGSRADVVLSVVGKQYQVLQNREAFRFFDGIVGMGRAVYETAGALDDGRVIWILARVPAELVTDNGEELRPYVLLANGHGRQVPVSLKLTTVRVVCANTLNQALNFEAGKIIRIAHNAAMRSRLASARELLGLIDRATLELRRFAERLRRVKVSDQQHEEYLKAVFPEPSPQAGGRLAETLRQQTRDYRLKALDLARCGAGNTARGVTGTLWAAYNGVTDLVDHYRPKGMSEDRFLRIVWFGQRDQAKRRAAREAERLAATVG